MDVEHYTYRQDVPGDPQDCSDNCCRVVIYRIIRNEERYEPVSAIDGFRSKRQEKDVKLLSNGSLLVG